MDADREWVLKKMGPGGLHVHEHAARWVSEEHARCAAAQLEYAQPQQFVYGAFWNAVLNRFCDEIKRLPGGSMQPPGSGRELPVLNGATIYPWRFTSKSTVQVDEVRFGKSQYRMRIPQLRPRDMQPTIEGLELAGFSAELPDLSAEEIELLEDVKRVRAAAGAMAESPFIVVGIASSSAGLHGLSWGEVTLADDGYLTKVDPWFNLMPDAERVLSDLKSRKTFVSGETPERKVLPRKNKAQ